MTSTVQSSSSSSSSGNNAANLTGSLAKFIVARLAPINQLRQFEQFEQLTQLAKSNEDGMTLDVVHSTLASKNGQDDEDEKVVFVDAYNAGNDSRTIDNVKLHECLPFELLDEGYTLRKQRADLALRFMKFNQKVNNVYKTVYQGKLDERNAKRARLVKKLVKSASKSTHTIAVD